MAPPNRRKIDHRLTSPKSPSRLKNQAAFSFPKIVVDLLPLDRGPLAAPRAITRSCKRNHNHKTKDQK
jgi:hypothetical protein